MGRPPRVAQDVLDMDSRGLVDLHGYDREQYDEVERVVALRSLKEGGKLQLYLKQQWDWVALGADW